MLVEKPVMLLDEPFSGLAQSAREAVGRMLANRARRQLICVAEHDLDRLFGIAERIVILVAGRIAGIHVPAELPSDRLIDYFGGTP